MTTSASLSATDAAIVLDTAAAKATLPKRREDNGSLSSSTSSELTSTGDHTVESLSNAQAEMKKAQPIVIGEDDTVRFGTKDYAQLKVLDTNDFAFAYFDSEAEQWLVAVSHGDPHLAAQYIDPTALESDGEFAHWADENGNLDINKVDFGEKFNGAELKEKGFDHIADYYNADGEGGTTFVTDGGVKITVDTEEIASGAHAGKTLGTSLYASVTGDDGEGTHGVEISLEKSEEGVFEKTLYEGDAAVAKNDAYNDGEMLFATRYTQSEEDSGKFFVTGDGLEALADLVPEGKSIAVLNGGKAENEVEVEAKFRFDAVEPDDTSDARTALITSAASLLEGVGALLKNVDGEIPESYVGMLENTADILDSVATLVNSTEVDTSSSINAVSTETTDDAVEEGSAFSVALADDEAPLSETDLPDDYLTLFNNATARLLSATSMLNV